ncbi:unnamed protein product [Cuscuta campestris]|uniref:Remorin C-terminal domain-containing protein n=1 Tax=Cuscuta campestris TaxID=132261 RepID=A0A484MUQ5_9ASTE|nr:unnamed protein product [Cuscuta campestris]
MRRAKEEENAGYATAVAAAAYAIKTDQGSSRDDEGRGGIRKEKTISLRSATLNNNNNKSTIKPAAPGKDLEPGEIAKSIRRNPTLADQMSGRTPSIKPAPEIQASAPAIPPNRQPSLRQTTPTPTTTAGVETKADIWEQEEMKKIKERYNEVISTTYTWEHTKKKKSNDNLEKIEKKLEARKAKAKADHKKRIREIEDASKKAKDWAKKKKENEERKVRDKADKYRRTGKAPSTFWCF